MKKFLFGLVLSVFMVCEISAAQVDAKYVNENLVPATALLYSQDAEGSMHMRCTATAIERTPTGFVFVTASHCGCDDDAAKKTVTPEKVEFYVTPDHAQEKDFLKAKVTACGYKHIGDDFMLLEVEAKPDAFTVVPLGEDPKVLDTVVNVASPQGLGKQVFIGSVSSAKLERPLIQDDINWTDVVTLQMFGVNGGSSGSSVICTNQKAICAFVVGSIGETTITAMPVSRLKVMQKAIKDGTYKHYIADPDAVGGK